MKRIISLIILWSFLALPVLATAPANVGRNLRNPLPASDVRVVKKTPLPAGVIDEEAKGKPVLPPGQEKTSSGAATGVLGEPLAEGKSKYAIVIGICQYPGEKYDICISDGDALNMYNALINLYGYNPANIYLLRDMEATYTAISNAVEDIKTKEAPGDEVVFFFSGHGANGIADDGDSEVTDEAIVTHNGIDALVFIWDGQLRDWFSGFETSRIAFVFDSCLAGGMNDVAAPGRVISMATGETQSAYVYSQGEYGEGVFSHYFVKEGMLGGKADKYDHDGDGIKPESKDVVVEEAFDYAKGKIPPYLKQRQKPVINDSFANDLLL